MVRARSLFENDDGVNVATEYIMVLVISGIVFTLLISSSQSLFIEGPSKTVTKNQFMDVGNDLDTKLIDTYLVAPRDGMISTTFDMPYEIAGYGYKAQISNSPNGDDKEVTVSSDQYTDVSAKLTLNGVNSTIPITGDTSSYNDKHWINYTSTTTT